MLSMHTTDATRDLLLLRHVVATCYPKILHRLNHTVGSKPFLNSLRQVAKLRFRYKAFEYSPPQSISSRNLSAREAEAKDIDMDFLRYYKIDAATIGSKIPHIVNKVHLLAAGNMIELYDRKTAAEFGILFGHLIDSSSPQSGLWMCIAPS